MGIKEVIAAAKEKPSSKSDNRQQRLQDPNQQLIELEMRKRLIKAKEFGRVTPEKMPDFIGNFDNSLPKGLFEMFIEEREGDNISGTIEDVYGTATFEGVLSDTEIRFTKHYIPEKSSIEASDCDLMYKGEYLSQIKEYLGRFVYKDHPESGKSFFISRDLSQLK
jgi:hypothetical protein